MSDYYSVGARVKLRRRSHVDGHWVTENGVISDIITNVCDYIFVYIDMDCNGEKSINIGKGNAQHSRLLLG